ncbi:MAG: M23 family metallopeptidase [Patescibacteria group bacterium]
MKRLAFTLGRLFGRMFSPLARFFLHYLVLPVYGVLFALHKRLSTWYRPAKNRFMFFLSNRYTIHGAVLLVVLMAVGANLQLSQARAEADTFGEKSLLYAIVTDQSVEVIDEYVDYSRPVASQIIDESTLRPFVTSNSTNPATPTSLVLGEGILSQGSVSSTTADTLAPREGLIAYTVGNGDTLSTIAHKFGITLNTLLWANNLTVRSVIKPGNTLNILPVSGVAHTVKSGDTVTAIAKKYGVNAAEVIAYNKLPSGSGLTVGAKLIVPGGEFKAPVPVATVRNVAVKDIFTGVPSSVGTSGNKPVAGKMLWPTDLKYVVRGLSWTHTGLDVDCNGHANGTSTNTNYAAADGIVQFSGAKRGYGNTVEINHGNGIVTRYGHFYQLYVKAGEQITMGTPLGRCGSTGNSTGTHLHFEVVVNGKFKNPLDYLR